MNKVQKSSLKSRESCIIPCFGFGIQLISNCCYLGHVQEQTEI